MPVDQYPLHPALGGDRVSVADHDLEEQASSVHFGQRCLGEYRSADRRGGLVVDLDAYADGGEPGVEPGSGRGHGGRLGEGEQPRGAEHGNVPGAQGLGSVGIGDGQLDAGGEAGGQFRDGRSGTSR